MIPRDFLEVRAGNAPVKIVTAAETLDVEDQLVLAVGGNYAITLPNCWKARGKDYLIYRHEGTVGSITVQDQDETANPYTSAATTVRDDFVLVRSFGYVWIELREQTTI